MRHVLSAPCRTVEHPCDAALVVVRGEDAVMIHPCRCSGLVRADHRNAGWVAKEYGQRAKGQANGTKKHKYNGSYAQITHVFHTDTSNDDTPQKHI